MIGVRDEKDVEKQRASVQQWERRIVQAVGSRAQIARMDQAAGDRQKRGPDAIPGKGAPA